MNTVAVVLIAGMALGTLIAWAPALLRLLRTAGRGVAALRAVAIGGGLAGVPIAMTTRPGERLEEVFARMRVLMLERASLDHEEVLLTEEIQATIQSGAGYEDKTE